MRETKTIFWRFCILLSLLLPIQMAIAQNFEVTGQVTDASTNQPLLGVNIVVEGTSNGEITDSEGNFSITVPGESSVLVFSYVGYTTKSITVGTQRIINLAMTPEAQEIDEVVAIGYGTIKKSDLTGAVSSVRQEDFEKVSPENVLTALQGRVPGVYISQNTGTPGIEPVIRIRGTGIHKCSCPYLCD